MKGYGEHCMIEDTSIYLTRSRGDQGTPSYHIHKDMKPANEQCYHTERKTGRIKLIHKKNKDTENRKIRKLRILTFKRIFL